MLCMQNFTEAFFSILQKLEDRWTCVALKADNVEEKKRDIFPKKIVWLNFYQTFQTALVYKFSSSNGIRHLNYIPVVVVIGLKHDQQIMFLSQFREIAFRIIPPDLVDIFLELSICEDILR